MRVSVCVSCALFKLTQTIDSLKEILSYIEYNMSAQVIYDTATFPICLFIIPYPQHSFHYSLIFFRNNLLRSSFNPSGHSVWWKIIHTDHEAMKVGAKCKNELEYEQFIYFCKLLESSGITWATVISLSLSMLTADWRGTFTLWADKKKRLTCTRLAYVQAVCLFEAYKYK